MITLSNVTGAAQTGLTSPTYDVTADTPPQGVRGKQYYVSAKGGTQAGVEVHSVGNSFTITFESPSAPKGQPGRSASTGQPISIPRNTTRILVRKGVEVVPDYRYNAEIDIKVNVPAGAEVQDPESVRAMLSFAIGALAQISSGLGDTLITGSP